jgi:DNA-directed RNA polymerase specialized sigma24 family protein
MDEPIHLVEGSEPPLSTLAESAGFEAFLIENQTRLFGSLCLMTGSRHEAEEIAQEAFVRVLERWDRVWRLDDPTGYLFATALNVFRKRLRRAGIALRRSIGVAPSEDAFGVVEDREVVLGAMRVASEYGDLAVQRSVLNLEADSADAEETPLLDQDWFLAKARDSQTGEYCRVGGWIPD